MLLQSLTTITHWQSVFTTTFVCLFGPFFFPISLSTSTSCCSTVFGCSCFPYLLHLIVTLVTSLFLLLLAVLKTELPLFQNQQGMRRS